MRNDTIYTIYTRLYQKSYLITEHVHLSLLFSPYFLQISAMAVNDIDQTKNAGCF